MGPAEKGFLLGCLILSALAFMFIVANWITDLVKSGKARFAEIKMSPEEALFIQLQEGCPDCGHDTLLSGPEAPGAVNVMCANCKSKFNIFTFVGTAERIRGEHQ